MSILKLQKGSILQPLVMQQDHTSAVKKVDLRNQVAQRNQQTGQLYDYTHPTYQGTISTPEHKSLREHIIDGLNKIDRNGDNMVAGLVTQPVKSAMRLLRFDKSYFSDIHNDDDVLGGVTNMGIDALATYPLAKGLSTGLANTVKIGGLVGDELSPVIKGARNTFNSTSDLPLTTRVKNAFNAGLANYDLPGDQTGHSYFDMKPGEALKQMAIDKANIPKGGMVTDGSMSINSHPLFWNSLARNSEDFTIVRPGSDQVLNSSGYMGKRVLEAVPEEMKPYADFVTKNYNKKINAFEKSKMLDRESLEDWKSRNSPNKNIMDRLLEKPNMYEKFLENYKPNLDKPIDITNAKTGLNFPKTNINPAEPYVTEEGIDEIHSPTVVAPSAMAINGVSDRFKNILGQAFNNVSNKFLGKIVPVYSPTAPSSDYMNTFYQRMAERMSERYNPDGTVNTTFVRGPNWRDY